MRRKTYFKEVVHQHPWRLFSSRRNPRDFREWIDQLRKGKPLVVELGIGGGDFLFQSAKADPDRFYLGIELKTDRIYLAFQKAEAVQLENVAYLQTDIEYLLDYGLPEVDELITLFGDPWPKERHADRRLTAPRHLKTYQKLLGSQGYLVIKTDHRDLYDFSQEMIHQEDWEIFEHDDNYQTPEELQTGYEKRFRAMNMPIYYLKCRPKK